MRKMPLKKQLSYLFACATGRDVLCSRLLREDKVVDVLGEFSGVPEYSMIKHYFRWAEARPVPGEKGKYSVVSCNYARNGQALVSGDRWYAEHDITKRAKTVDVFFSREQALSALQQFEENRIVKYDMHVVAAPPRAFRALIARSAPVPDAP